MPENCAKCRKIISRNSPGIKCRGTCEDWYHPECVNLPSSFVDVSNLPSVLWSCPTCVAAHNESHEGNSRTVVDNKMSEALMNFENIKLKQDEFLRSMDFMSSNFDNFNAKFNEINIALQNIDVLQKELTDLKKENQFLKQEIEDLQQYSRRNNIEINGIPERNGENVSNIVTKIAETLGVKLNESSIDDCHRVPRRINSKMPKSIVVKFTSRSVKRNIIAASKIHRDRLHLAAIGVPDAQGKIFLSDHLTLNNKNLLFKTKAKCRENNYKYVWVSDCKILVRKNDNSKIIHVANESVLSKLN